MISFNKSNITRIISVVLVIVFFQSTIFSAEAQAGKSEIRSKYLGAVMWENDHFLKNSLAVQPMCAPTIDVNIDEAGNVTYTEPVKADIHTEAALAFVAYAAGMGMAEGSLSEYIENTLQGANFEECRLGYVDERGDAYFALYRREGAAGTPGEVVDIRFSGLQEDVEVPEGQGAVIKLADNRRVLVEARYKDDHPRDAGWESRDDLITIQNVAEIVKQGRTGAALEALFTDSRFQQGNRPQVFAGVCNALIEDYSWLGGNQRADIKEFLNAAKQGIVEFSSHKDIARAVQLLAGQTLTIISWIERSIPGTAKMRVTANKSEMITSGKGESYILNNAENLPPGVGVVEEEGGKGLYWRGSEGMAKLGYRGILRHENVLFDEKKLEDAKAAEALLMYLMDHGVLEVPAGLEDLTDDGIVSTFHETSFLHDFLPGSFQATSTGAGHDQASKLDIKYVTEGRGIQVNVRYGADGKVKEVILQRVEKGQWAFALPGCVDYMINLGGLRFNDTSVDLDLESKDKKELAEKYPELAEAFPGIIEAFNSHYGEEDPGKVSEAIEKLKKDGKLSAPFLGVRRDGKDYLVANSTEDFDVIWRSAPVINPDATLAGIYSGLEENNLRLTLETFKDGYRAAAPVLPESAGITMFDDADSLNDLLNIEGSRSPTFRKTEGICSYADENVPFLSEIFNKDVSGDKLVRIPVESAKIIGPDNLKGILSEMSKAGNVYFELYSAEGEGAVGDDEYEELGIEKKEFPHESSRENTVTLLPVWKAEKLFPRDISIIGKRSIGEVDPTKTILSPVGYNFDRTGLVRSIFLGLRLARIAELKRKAEAEPDNAELAGSLAGFIRETLDQYKAFCRSQGFERFTVKEEDLLNIAAGEDVNRILQGLNKLIESLPIVPVNPEELREVYERAMEAVIRA